jgi:hypothetical protein
MPDAAVFATAGCVWRCLCLAHVFQQPQSPGCYKRAPSWGSQHAASIKIGRAVLSAELQAHQVFAEISYMHATTCVLEEHVLCLLPNVAVVTAINLHVNVAKKRHRGTSNQHLTFSGFERCKACTASYHKHNNRFCTQQPV